MAKKALEKMSVEEIKNYYETKGLIMGAVFAFILLAIALVGFFIGFNGVVIQ
ncbi:MAG: hypothetical protein IJB71_02920 [Bacilli bacterium]|nr:hypothetical protein [Bacilli bacterium]